MVERATDRSFRRFYDEHVRRVTALAVALSADPAVAEDIVQEAFLRAYRDWDRVQAYDDPGAWVRRVAANLSHSRWRRLRSEGRALVRLGPPRPAPAVELPTDGAAVWGAVRQLPRRQAVAIALHYVDDLPVAEVAAVMGISEGTAKAHLHRGRQRLADVLRDEVTT